MLWLCIGEGFLRCFVNLSPKDLEVSSMYSSSHIRSLHWNQYMAPLLLWRFFKTPINNSRGDFANLLINELPSKNEISVAITSDTAHPAVHGGFQLQFLSSSHLIWLSRSLVHSKLIRCDKNVYCPSCSLSMAPQTVQNDICLMSGMEGLGCPCVRVTLASKQDWTINILEVHLVGDQLSRKIKERPRNKKIGPLLYEIWIFS